MSRDSFPVTNQDEFNQNVVRAIRDLYLLSLPPFDPEVERTCPAEDIGVRDRIAELDAYAFRDDYAALNLEAVTPVPATEPD